MVLPLRLAQKPAEVGPSSPCHDSPHWEGDLLGQRSDQLLHCFHHGLGVRAVWQLRHIESSEAWGNGSLWILLLDKCQKPAESRDSHLSRPLQSLVGSYHGNGEQPGLLSLCLEIGIRALKNSSGLHTLLLVSPVQSGRLGLRSLLCIWWSLQPQMNDSDRLPGQHILNIPTSTEGLE